MIASTNRDLEEMGANREFREDLFYRLNVIPLSMPPLRDRRDDIPMLARHFVQQLSATVGRPRKTITDEMLEELQRYDWPGNIRELRNVIERAIILSTDGTLRIPEDMVKTVSAANGQTAFPTLAQNERQHIAAALKKCNDVIGGPSGVPVCST